MAAVVEEIYKYIEENKDCPFARVQMFNDNLPCTGQMKIQITHFKLVLHVCMGMYGAPAKMTDLKSFRFNFFIKATAKDTSVLLSTSPRISDIAFEHLKRVYLQIQIWLGNDLIIEKCGWIYSINMYHTINMNQLPAPEKLLKILLCFPKRDVELHAGKVNCSLARLQCKDNSCLNTAPVIQIDEIEDDI
ncbi:hypothetical protein EVAR_15921_1 [Eumeta japonica]|uniref:Uncharacterized protein n=1 Tax=Eumeta variegata TaxID=151549 RepID=A0A4C1UL13_EUMVA|nr:hypothetical protein EVAR_15921_1 [Eumeta japonica]